MIKQPDIEGLDCARVECVPAIGGGLLLTIDCVSADEFVTCCDEELLREIIRNAGQTFCDGCFGPPPDEIRSKAQRLLEHAKGKAPSQKQSKRRGRK